MAQMGRRGAQEEQRQRQGGMNGTTAVQACSTQRRQQASDKPTSQASITPSQIFRYVLTSVVIRRPHLKYFLSSATGVAVMHQAPVVDMAETSVPNLGMKPKISERTSNTKATMGTSCCSYNTCEDSTIKCTMTQFEDQFSTIKPDGIQVRYHKEYEI
uniref:Uncharacterized protein n=1 Tax=Oryza nivara TaxID=4536 RepID=A0A0E0IR27_ORYNI